MGLGVPTGPQQPGEGDRGAARRPARGGRAVHAGRTARPRPPGRAGPDHGPAAGKAGRRREPDGGRCAQVRGLAWRAAALRAGSFTHLIAGGVTPSSWNGGRINLAERPRHQWNATSTARAWRWMPPPTAPAPTTPVLHAEGGDPAPSGAASFRHAGAPGQPLWGPHVQQGRGDELHRQRLAARGRRGATRYSSAAPSTASSATTAARSPDERQHHEGRRRLPGRGRTATPSSAGATAAT